MEQKERCGAGKKAIYWEETWRLIICLLWDIVVINETNGTLSARLYPAKDHPTCNMNGGYVSSLLSRHQKFLKFQRTEVTSIM
jgi:hypothetical protein